MSDGSDATPMNVDMDLLITARTSWDRSSTEFYLDTQTGDVVTVPVSVLKGETPVPEGNPEMAEQVAAIQAGGERYLRIPPLPERAEQILMEKFAETVKDAELSAKLHAASADPKGYRMFRRLLHGSVAERRRWQEFRAKHLGANAEKWLASEGLRR